MCRNTPNAKACQYEDTYEHYNCYAFFGDGVKNCNGLPVDMNDEEEHWPCMDFEDMGLGCTVFSTSIPAPRSALTCTGNDFYKKIEDWKLESPGIKLFGCGKDKIKSKCKLGCEQGYKLKDTSQKNEVVLGSDGKVKGIKTTKVAKCIDGVVMGQQSPEMSKEQLIIPKPMIPICRKWFAKNLFR
jgi:hypothetical protein